MHSSADVPRCGILKWLHKCTPAQNWYSFDDSPWWGQTQEQEQSHRPQGLNPHWPGLTDSLWWSTFGGCTEPYLLGSCTHWLFEPQTVQMAMELPSSIPGKDAESACDVHNTTSSTPLAHFLKLRINFYFMEAVYQKQAILKRIKTSVTY